MRFSAGPFADPSAALARRVLETDGLGGWAATSLLGCNVSRFDGVLVVRTSGRAVLLVARIDAALAAGGGEFPLSTARYPGTFHPEGLRHLTAVGTWPAPRWTSRIGDATVVFEWVRERGERRALLRWTVSGVGGPSELLLTPFVAARAADALTYRNEALREHADADARSVVLRPYPSHPAVVLTPGGASWRFEARPVWHERVEYADDIARGYPGHEDLFSPGRIRVALDGDGAVVLAVAAGPATADPRRAFEREIGRRGPEPAALRERLDASAEAFLYRAEGGRTGVIAGYPWFGEWGRDTCIALPGLLLARDRVEECGEALSGLRRFLRAGRLPNLTGGGGEPGVYGALDPSLWFARAVELYDHAGGLRERVLEDLRPALEEIAREYEAAAADDVTSDDSGLLRGGSPERAGTWMDAVVGGRAVTPRHGFAVETNALWHALRVHLAVLARRAGDRASEARHRGYAALVARSFLDRLWMPQRRLLADQWIDGAPDPSVRPNAVVAASLAASPLSRAQRRAVVRLARRDLLTPRGLRTLSPRDPAYRGRFAGDVVARDLAYHQGTVWPWLIGPFVEAALRAYGPRRRVVAWLRALLDGFAPHLDEHGIGHVSEVFDGDPPHAPGGTYAQAWSTSELLRAFRLLDAAARGDPLR